MKATEDFFLAVLHAHILSAAHTLLSTSSNLHTTLSLSTEIVDAFVDIDLSGMKNHSSDGIHEYAREMLTLLLIWHAFHDATKEGDGGRLMLLWKLLMLIFKVTNRRNYAKEAVILLVQKECLFSEHKAAQLTWSRCVNVHGFKGHNILTDLHMEHLNKRLKLILQCSATALNPNSILRAAKSIGFIHTICCAFESECSLRHHHGQHKLTSFAKDLSKMIDCLQENEVFLIKKDRCHISFPIAKRLIQSLDNTDIESWIINNILPTLLFA